jgi:hypothetical protein
VHDRGVGGELARRQSLKIHLALKLGVILLAQGMPLVQFDHFVLGDREVGPPALQPQPGGGRGEAVELAIGSGGTFFLGVGVILSENVHIQRHMPGFLC